MYSPKHLIQIDKENKSFALPETFILLTLRYSGCFCDINISTYSSIDDIYTPIFSRIMSFANLVFNLGKALIVNINIFTASSNSYKVTSFIEVNDPSTHRMSRTSEVNMSLTDACKCYIDDKYLHLYLTKSQFVELLC